MNVHDAVLLFGAFVTILTAWGIAAVARHRLSETERVSVDHGKRLMDIERLMGERGVLLAENNGQHDVFDNRLGALEKWRDRQEDRWTHERPAP